jgi:hypothetical protein
MEKSGNHLVFVIVVLVAAVIIGVFKGCAQEKQNEELRPIFYTDTPAIKIIPTITRTPKPSPTWFASPTFSAYLDYVFGKIFTYYNIETDLSIKAENGKPVLVSPSGLTKIEFIGENNLVTQAKLTTSTGENPESRGKYVGLFIFCTIDDIYQSDAFVWYNENIGRLSSSGMYLDQDFGNRNLSLTYITSTFPNQLVIVVRPIGQNK